MGWMRLVGCCWLIVPGCFLVETVDSHSGADLPDASLEAPRIVPDGGKTSLPDAQRPVTSSPPWPLPPDPVDTEPPELVPTILPDDANVILSPGGGLTLPALHATDGGAPDPAAINEQNFYNFESPNCPSADSVEFDELHWQAELPVGTTLLFDLQRNGELVSGGPLLTLTATAGCSGTPTCAAEATCNLIGPGATCIRGMGVACDDDMGCRTSGNSRCVDGQCSQPTSPTILSSAIGGWPVGLRVTFQRNDAGEAPILRSLRTTYFCHVSI